MAFNCCFCCFVATVVFKPLVISVASDGGRGGSKCFCCASATVVATGTASMFTVVCDGSGRRTGKMSGAISCEQ